MHVGGLERWSMVDWPGELVATVFCQGCSWRCPYCHNAVLRPATSETEIPEADVMTFLNKRKGLLDGVVFSGGEPLLQGDLFEVMTAVKALGYRIGLHTGGPSPERFAKVLPLVDWVGFDIKAPFDEYDRITRVPGSGAKAKESLKLLLLSAADYELRTTVHPKLLDAAAIDRLNADLAALGAGPTKIQEFRPQGCTDPELLASA